MDGASASTSVATDQVSVVHRRAPFAEALVTGELPRIAAAFERVIEDSYVTHPMRNRTTRENRRRGEIVCDAFKQMQGEFGWTTDRCLASLRDALAAKLDGRPWGPPKDRTLWAPDPTLTLDQF
jgi:hypothetical protein